jgi:hypothetical protein
MSSRNEATFLHVLQSSANQYLVYITVHILVTTLENQPSVYNLNIKPMFVLCKS